MKNRIIKKHRGPMFPVLFILAMVALHSRSFGQHNVVLKGRVITPSHLQEPVVVTLEALSDGETMPVDIRRNGRFHIVAPATDGYLVHFTQRGTITKTIRVDGQHANRRNALKDRLVGFDVVLAASDHAERMSYAVPVGHIGFEARTGRMTVEHKYHLTEQTSSLMVDDAR